MNDIVEKFTTHLRSVLVRSVTFAEEGFAKTVELNHLLYALSSERGSLGAEILQKTKFKPEDIFKKINDEKRIGGETNNMPEFSAAAKKILQKAVLTASLYDHSYVGTEHLLAAVAAAEKDLPSSLGVAESDIKIIKHELQTVLKTTSKFPDIASNFRETKGAKAVGIKEHKQRRSKTPALDFFAVDLSKSETLSRLDPIFGREAELERVIQILSRRTKNNPILLGDPGVGKTAIVEGLAQRIAQSNVPDTLLGKRILTVDLALLISGAVYRGEFESRLKQILDEAKNDPDIILFIDEVHMIVGAGAASGSLDAANILKPALARGEIRCIGATTFAEYKKHIETDAALERRFQSVIIAEPTNDETSNILRALKEKYESYHRVRISEEAINKAVELAGRYIQEKYFPDKAIDLIDEAAAAKKISRQNSGANQVRSLLQEREKLAEEKQKAVLDENFKLALELKARESDLNMNISEAQKSQNKEKDWPEVNGYDIAKTVSRITRIPEADLLGNGAPMAEIETRLRAKIRGQDEIIKLVAETLGRARADLRAAERPLASFLFLGPTGVGKTELAKCLAAEYFGRKDAFIRIDMSEFREPFQMSKLIGAPAGYVGYREATKLTDLVKARPYSLVLFDEIEKAHSDVLNLLLQILEEGELTDSVGRKINFRNTIIILTSNLGGNLFKKSALGFSAQGGPAAGGGENEEVKKCVLDEVKNILRPEFINRLDQIHIFRELTVSAMEEIVELRLEELNWRIREKGIRLTLSPTAAAMLAEEAMAKKEGARAVRRVIETRVESALANTLLTQKIAPGSVFTVKCAKGNVGIEQKR
ncbi:ATP-dependent Clp protease ATP-binding subunit [Candidatus Uhrbacteria bacterium]|nr:ATP-dependent Clp protease ATP-binding subunit [Candidatus Uhrbacteria bacterium]